MGRSYINRLISQNKKRTHFAITLKDIKSNAKNNSPK